MISALPGMLLPATSLGGTTCAARARTGLLLLRSLSVLSWGRNSEHQCGIEGLQPVILQPTVVLELMQQPVTALTAGKNNSAAVLQGGEVYVFGDGSCGKLGLGSGDDASSPSRVEAFVGRSAIQAVSLGCNHSLFLDAEGQLWAAGENKEGQCGLGTPLSELAVQYRRAYHEAMRPLTAAAISQNRPNLERFAQQALQAAAAAQADATGGGAAHTAHGWGSLGSSWGRSSSSFTAGQPGDGSSDRGRSWLSGPAGGGRHADPWDTGSSGGRGRFAPPPPSISGGISSTGQWGGTALQSHLQALHMQPGQMHTPVRVGCERAPSMLFEQPEPGAAAGATAAASNSSNTAAAETTTITNSSSDSSGDAGLAGERVVSMATSKYFSVAATARGEVWTWGACYNGALGAEAASWQTSATRVSAAISAALAARGGAVAVTAGATFAAALTASGRVVVWGKLVAHSGGTAGTAGSDSSGRTLQPAAGGSQQGSTLDVVQRLAADAAAGAAAAAAAVAEGGGGPSDSSSSSSWCEVALPPGTHITHIAAGQQHLLLSDGTAVWAVGRWMDDAGDEAGCAPAGVPVQLMALPPGSSLTKLAAGMHSSAAVDSAGRLWLWGRLLDEGHARSLTRAVAHVGGGGAPLSRGAAAAAATVERLRGVDWGWAGFGGALPRIVPGLSGVRDVALGGWHALALVD